jgi:hypothetical protein
MRKHTSHAIVALAVTALAGLAADRTAPAASVTITLENPTVTTSTAVFNVDLSFQGNPGDLLNTVQLSVVGSDPALTAGGTDYSRFRFQLNTAAVPGWSELAPINPTTGFDLNAPNDPVNGPFIGPTSGLLFGTLTVNLAGIALGTSLFATLAGGTLGVDATDVAGVVGGTTTDSFAAAGLLTVTPGRVEFSTVPEPRSLAMAVTPVLLGLVLAARHWARSRLRRVNEMASARATH